MERELKIVVSVFLVYFIYGLVSYFDSGAFVTFFFFARLTTLVIALLFSALNYRQPGAYVLFLYVVAIACFTLNDGYSIRLLDQLINTPVFSQLSESLLFATLSLIIYLGFLLLSVWFFYRSTGQIAGTTLLFINLLAFILLLGTDTFLLREVLIHVFFLFYFILAQRDSNLKNKVLRVLSYQYLLGVLLESFEYFV